MTRLQTQLRQYEALQETRESLLKLRPNARKNWMTLAVAYHLAGNLPYAKNVLENYVRMIKVCKHNIIIEHAHIQCS